MKKTIFSVFTVLFCFTLALFQTHAYTGHVSSDQSTIQREVDRDFPPTEEWVARYNGPGNDNDLAFALEVDGVGNVYVTGESWGSSTEYDYATIKYNTEGSMLWVARYNGPGNGWDVANGIAVDGSGNVYVTGESWGSGTDADYATIKYDSSGTQLWAARYNGPGDGPDVATAITVDGLGNVYVTGKSGHDYATLKYSSSGTQLWAARYIDPGHSSATAIAVDGSGNVYVTGSSGNSYQDYATIKYDSSGTQLWVAKYDGQGHRHDYAKGIAVDGLGNVYVTGWSFGSITDHDYATVKYNSIGTQLWVARYDGPVCKYDYANAIAVDGSGNVYVTGESWGSGTDADYATIKYNTEGSMLWVARYNGPGNYGDQAHDLEVDGSGNVYVTGYSAGSDTYYDYATIKYDTSGNQLWIARYNGPGDGMDSAIGINVDGLGNVYVTGCSISDSKFDYATIMYNQCIDNDGDGYIEETCGGWDCDDTDPRTYPDAIEICDGKDNDCDGTIPEDEIDNDDDGYVECEPWIGTDTSIIGGNDCDDAMSAVNPGADERCDNGIDDDCDGLVDGEDWRTCPLLNLEASYLLGTLHLDFSLATPKGALWKTYLILTIPTVCVISLWSVPLQVVGPPVEIPVSFPFPSVEWIGIYTGLFTVEGDEAVDLDWVHTGWPNP